MSWDIESYLHLQKLNYLLNGMWTKRNQQSTNALALMRKINDCGTEEVLIYVRKIAFFFQKHF